MAREIAQADDWGLDAGAIKLPKLDPAAANPPSHEDLIETERLLSLAALAYARQARGGRIPDPAKQLSSYLDRLPQVRDPKLVMQQLATTEDRAGYLRGLHPRYPQFERLRQRYLALKREGDDAASRVKIPSAPSLSPGGSDEIVPLLRTRLEVAPPSGAEDPNLYDDRLVEAVKAFQASRGVKADGVVGGRTRKLLNDVATPDPSRILANMEQWRWMPDDLGDTYLWTNLPEYTVRVMKGGSIVHEERMIAGQVSKQTPVFSDRMESVVIHPRWLIPESIKIREIYPSLVRRGGTRGFKILKNGRKIDPRRVSWGSVDIRHYDIYQPPGPSNALGTVKLLFPNKHSVYFHDTPNKGLFNSTDRAFSHGCMRVRNPQRLAALVLAEDKGWTSDYVATLFDAPSEENVIALDQRLPVHVTYFTAWIDDDGRERVFKDVYGHEKRIKLALAGQFDRIARGPDHLAPIEPVRIAAPRERRYDRYRDRDEYGSYIVESGPRSRRGRYRTSTPGGLFGGFFSGGD